MYRVLLPVDDNTSAAERAVDTVLSLPGEPTELAVIVLHVSSQSSGSMFTGERIGSGTRVAGMDASEFYDEVDLPKTVSDAHDRLAEAGVQTTVRHEQGEPDKQIVSVAQEVDAELIVMSGRKRSPSGKAVFGSVTQSVLLSADIPVTVLMHDR